MPELYRVLADESTPVRVLVSGLDNWIDAGLGATAALAAMTSAEGVPESVPIVSFDTDLLVDHQARRPTMELVDGVNRALTWPSIDLSRAADPDEHPYLLLRGAEPDHRWRAFSAAVVELCQRFGVELVVGLGAYPAPAPHTRDPRVVATATSEALAARVGFLPGRMDVPASINAAVERACADAGIDAIGLWAQVPHYVSNFPYPAASAALLTQLGEVTGLRFPVDDLLTAATETRARIDQLVAQNEEHAGMVRQLERLVDERMAPGPLPSADELGAELEQFLRNRET
jgi:proteasome assembly chaperone (PAC2) family protein